MDEIFPGKCCGDAFNCWLEVDSRSMGSCPGMSVLCNNFVGLGNLRQTSLQTDTLVSVEYDCDYDRQRTWLYNKLQVPTQENSNLFCWWIVVSLCIPFYLVSGRRWLQCQAGHHYSWWVICTVLDIISFLESLFIHSLCPVGTRSTVLFSIGIHRTGCNSKSILSYRHIDFCLLSVLHI